MKRIVSLAAAIALLCLPTNSDAWLAQKPIPYTGPGDVKAFTVWYGLRGYSYAKAAAGTTKMMRIRYPTSGEYCDVLVSSSGGLGLTTDCTSSGAGQTVSAFCNGGDCKVHTWYNQVGNTPCAGSTTCDIVQATEANQPTLRSADSYLSIETAATTVSLLSATNFTPSTVKMSFSAVGNRVTGTGSGRMLTNFGSNNAIVATSGTANQWSLFANSTAMNRLSVNDNAWHTGNGTIDNTSSAFLVDGLQVTSPTLNASTVAAAPLWGVSATSTTLRSKESGAIDNVALSSGERSALETNAKNYWGI